MDNQITNANGEPQELNAGDMTALMQLPQATPGVVSPLVSPMTTGAAPAHGGELDRHGVAYDPRRHEHRIKANGSWALKRGNGARLAAGKPLAGSTSGHAPRAKDEPAAPETTATTCPQVQPGPVAQPQESRPGPFLAMGEAGVPPEAMGPGNASVPPASAAGTTMVPEVMRGPADYQLTAEGLTSAQFGIMSMALGKAWEPEREESKAWTEAWKRTMAHYQTPILGPLLELFVLLVGSVSKRWHDATTNARVGAVWRWMRKEPKPAQPDKVA
jgi:hypothetical protein